MRRPRILDTVSACLVYLVVMIGAIGWIIPLSSCSWQQKRLPKDKVEVPDVSDPIKKTGTIADGVRESADTIDIATQEIEKATPEEIKPKIETHIDQIHAETGDLRNMSADLKETQGKLEEEQSKIVGLMNYASSLEGSQDKLRKQIEDLKADNRRLLNNMLAWLAAACVAGIGICTFIAFLTRSKLAVFAAVGCSVTMCIAVAVSAYMTYFALVTAGVFAVVSVFAGIFVYREILKKKKEIVNTKAENSTVNQALQEVVQTGELAKKYMTIEARQHVFGDGPEPGKADQLQSEPTKVLVRTLRESKVKIAGSVPTLFRQGQVLPKPSR